MAKKKVPDIQDATATGAHDSAKADRPTRVPGQELLDEPGPELEAYKLFALDNRELYKFLREAEAKRTAIDLAMGRAADTVIERHRYMTPSELDDLFGAKCGLDGDEAVALQLGWLAYGKDPAEIARYRRTAARILSNLTAAQQRAETWEYTGSVDALRQLFCNRQAPQPEQKPARRRLKLIFRNSSGKVLTPAELEQFNDDNQ